MRALTLSLLLLLVAVPGLAAEAPRPECPSGQRWSSRRGRCVVRHRIEVCGPLVVTARRNADAIILYDRKELPERPLLQAPDSFLPQR